MTEVHPVTYSLVPAAELLAAIGRTYGLASNASCQLLRSGLHDTYVIVSGAERFVVRVYRVGTRSVAEVGYELEFLTHLAASGVSVAAPVPDREGRAMQLLPAPEGCRPVALFSYAKGTRLSWTESESRLAGALLAQIHQASDGFIPVHARANRDLTSLVDRPLAAIERFLTHRADDAAFLRGFAARGKSRLKAVAAELESGVCHGDFGAKNIHIDGDGRMTAFDFDRCGPGWRAGDFALIRWAAVGRRKPAMWDAFIDGYCRIRPLRRADLEAVPLFHGLALLSALGLRARYADIWGRARVDDTALDGWLTAFREWEAQQAVTAGSAVLT